MEKLFEYIQRELAFAKYLKPMSMQKKKEVIKSAYERAYGALTFYTMLYPEDFDTVARIWIDEYEPLFEQIISK